VVEVHKSKPKEKSQKQSAKGFQKWDQDTSRGSCT
jgi:hypothetical protein